MTIGGARRTLTRLEDLDAGLARVEADPFEAGSGQQRLRLHGNLALQGNNPSRLTVLRGADVSCRLEVDAPELTGGGSEWQVRFGRNTTPLNVRFQLYQGATLAHELHSSAAAAFASSLCRQGQTLLVGGTAATGGSGSVALLELQSTTKGLLLPRLTTAQREALGSPPAGLLIYNSSTGKLNVRGASAWETVTSG